MSKPGVREATVENSKSIKKSIMKKQILLFLILVNISCSKSEKQTQQQAVNLNCLPSNLQTDVIAFYSFNSGSLNDTSGNSNNLTNSTTAIPGVDRDGNAGCAFHFNNVNNEFLKLNNPTFLDNLQSAQFSVSLWYKSEIQGGQLLSRGNDFGNCHGGIGEWHLALWDNNYPIFFINGERNIATTATYQVNEWHHLVVTNNVNDTKIFQDGVLLGDNEFTVCTTPGQSLNVGDLYIGEYFKGTIDDIIIYKRELTLSEIGQLAALNSCCQ